MSQDIKHWLEKLIVLEGQVTPSVYPKHGLNKQQQKVPQLPALFKPNKITALTNKDNPQHPAKKFFVGSESKDHEIDFEDKPQAQTEDVITTVRKGLNDYLHALEKKMDQDDSLATKAKNSILNPDINKLLPVKTVLTHDGKQLKIHGNENDGFVVKINERPVSVRFPNLEHAEMACEMYCNKRMALEQKIQDQDYMDEE
jgi:hypothetical protein